MLLLFTFFWGGGGGAQIYFNRPDILCILHGFVHVFKVGFAHPTHFLCETSTQHLLAVSGVRITECGANKESEKKIRW